MGLFGWDSRRLVILRGCESLSKYTFSKTRFLVTSSVMTYCHVLGILKVSGVLLVMQVWSSGRYRFLSIARCWSLSSLLSPVSRREFNTGELKDLNSKPSPSNPPVTHLIIKGELDVVRVYM